MRGLFQLLAKIKLRLSFEVEAELDNMAEIRRKGFHFVGPPFPITFLLILFLK